LPRRNSQLLVITSVLPMSEFMTSAHVSEFHGLRVLATKTSSLRTTARIWLWVLRNITAGPSWATVSPQRKRIESAG
jgi:hypothetical protein